MPGSLGGLACLLIVNLLPRHRRQILIGIGIVAVIGSCIWTILWAGEARELGVGTRTWFESLLYEMSFLGGSLVPFHWMSRGIKYAAVGDAGKMAYNLGLVWSNGLFLYLVTVWLAGETLSPRLQPSRDRRRPSQTLRRALARSRL